MLLKLAASAIRPRSAWHSVLAIALGVWFSGCQTTDPPPAETVLWVKLNDSLSTFEKVVVQVVDRNDSNAVITTLWNNPLPFPGKDIPGYPLKSLANKSFIVKVTGYKAGGQLALYTQITYEGGKKSVYHKDVPPLVAHDWLTKLTPSTGTMSPAFNKDSLTYTLNIPKDASVSFSLTAFSGTAAIAFEGDPVPAGQATKPIIITAVSDTLKAMVTDNSTGTPVTRTYRIIIIPTLPPGLYLATLVPSAGTLTPAFRPETQVYSLVLPLGIDTVAFTVSPADPRTMTMTVAGKGIFPGQKSQTFKIDPGSSFPIPIEVNRSGELSYYQVTVEIGKP